MKVKNDFPREGKDWLPRFWQKLTLNRESGCWEWRGCINQGGYGMFRMGGKTVSTHRAIYERCYGSIDPKLTIDHLCRNRACQNPFHMEQVTSRVNTLRGNSMSAIHAKKTHCPDGHPYDEKNTYIYKNRRCCRLCGWARKLMFDLRKGRYDSL